MRILVVEDESLIADNLKLGLEAEKFAVDVARTGTEGYDLASTEDYDVIILDIGLPGMDGMTICSKLRAEKNFAPILMLTARDTTDDKIKGLQFGADDYLVKPFSFKELVARIRALIRRNGIKTPVLTFGNIELDPASHKVLLKGVEIKLTGKEYTLLEYFMNHPGQTLTREQILSHVWDYSYDSFSNTIDVMVKRLREKIDKDKKLFSTIRGIGYRFG